MPPLRQSLSYVIAILIACPISAVADSFSFFHEDVLGTSLELQVSTTDAATARTAEASALAEIDRLEKVFSHYTSESELSQFVALNVGQSMSASPELIEVFSMYHRWTSETAGACNAAAEVFSQEWTQAAQKNVRPSAIRLAELAEEVRHPHWQIDSNRKTITRLSQAPLTLNAIAKGYILDCVCNRLLHDEVDGVLVNIGGDIRAAGSIRMEVDIPADSADVVGLAASPSVTLANGAIATSGRSERGFKINGQWFSHIIDPRSGLPASHVVSASVIAPTAAEADALATICNVLPVHDSLRLVSATTVAACLIQLNDGRVLTSSNWPENDLLNKEMFVAFDDAAKSAHKMTVEFVIAKPGDARRYRRPYVAVWIEDKDGWPVKTLALFLMQNNPGPRWYRDLRRWYGGDQMRLTIEDGDIIKTVSKPSRNPGTYKVSWDGTDNAGKPLKTGSYTLLIESAREHGNYRLIKHDFQLGQAFAKELKANEEISAAKVQYDVE